MFYNLREEGEKKKGGGEPTKQPRHPTSDQVFAAAARWRSASASTLPLHKLHLSSSSGMAALGLPRLLMGAGQNCPGGCTCRAPRHLAHLCQHDLGSMSSFEIPYTCPNMLGHLPGHFHSTIVPLPVYVLCNTSDVPYDFFTFRSPGCLPSYWPSFASSCILSV